MKDVRKVIRGLIREKGSVRKIATDLGMDHANLIRSLRDGGNPGLKTIEKILDFLGYEIRLIRSKKRK